MATAGLGVWIGLRVPIPPFRSVDSTAATTSEISIEQLWTGARRA